MKQPWNLVEPIANREDVDAAEFVKTLSDLPATWFA